MKVLGRHVIVELVDCDRAVLDNLELIREHMLEAARKSGATVVRSVFHRYNPQGVSGVVVIAESHISVHTWPEYGYAAVDFFTCGDSVDPETVVKQAIDRGCKSISYTYTEPTVLFEFALDTARLAHKKGLLNIFVTNGYMTPEALKKIGPYLDAANVDLKAFNDDFYRTYCSARLEPVKETLLIMKSQQIFVEVTTLLIPGLNDRPKEIEAMAYFLAQSLGTGTPWHISRFHPTYKMTNRSSTPVQTLVEAREIGLAAGLAYVYLGNVPGDDGEKTYCPECGEVLVNRWGYHIRSNRIENGRCANCGTVIAGIAL